MGPILNWWYRDSVDGVTNPLTGTMYLPSNFSAKKCLSFNEWERVFFRSVFHEGMHSTDSIGQRLSGERHELIYNRVDVEATPRSLPQPKKPTWGTPRPNRVDTNALYREYLSKSPDCNCTP
jgi:hypothetical protein